MIEHRKRKPSKRELLETDGYVKHNRAKPYVRDNRIVVKELETVADKEEVLKELLGDWDTL